MTEAERLAWVERVCEAAGVVLISEHTAAAIDAAWARHCAGLPVSERQLAGIRYAIAVATPRPVEVCDSLERKLTCRR
jgi:hypothetical protein